MLSHFNHVWLFVTLQTIACQTLLSIGFFRQECWSRLPCFSPGELDPGIQTTSLISPALVARFLSTSTTWEALYRLYVRAICDFQEDLCRDTYPRMVASSAPVPETSYCQSMLLQETLKHSQGRSDSVSYGVSVPFSWSLVHIRFYSCLLRVESLFPPVLWQSCHQIPLACKIRFPGDFQSLFWIRRLGSLIWGLEPSQ